jgi:integrase/recombinase XerD
MKKTTNKKPAVAHRFSDYLIDIGITPGMYINRMNNLVNPYLEWLESKQIMIEAAKYKDLMNFIGYMLKQGKSKFHVNRTLQVISHYYQYKELPNIAQTTRLRGLTRSQPQNLLTEEELDLIYGSYETKQSAGIYYHSDKIILGMIIYQGLDMREFMGIELHHLQLEKGQIYVGERQQKRERYLPLQANQVLSLDRFIRETRPQLIQEESDKLFAPQADHYNLLHWQFKQLSKKVKGQTKAKLNIEIHKISQLRQSRIASWVREEGLRKAQYLAGFKTVSSAERYQKADLTDLKAQVEIYHPLQYKESKPSST